MIVSGAFGLIGIEDGIGYEYCYKATQYNVRPNIPTSEASGAGIPTGWSSSAPDISAINAYIWESYRTVKGSSRSYWSTPTLKNRWAYDGDKGAKMRMRTWESGVRYLQGAEGEEFYDIVVYETKLYLCTKTHTSSSSNNPIESIESYLGYWESAQQWTFIATQLLLAGKIVTDKITADLIDADGITAKNADISGKITATSGKIGGWSIVGNNLECYGFNTKINVEASGSKFMRINDSEEVMCAIRSDNSTALSVSTYGGTNEAIGIRVYCNGYGRAIEAYGNIILNARPDEYVSIKGLKLNIRSVSSSQDINRNDDYLFCSGNITIKLPSPQAMKGKIYHIRRSSGTLTLTCYYQEGSAIKPFFFLDGRNDYSTNITTTNLHSYISNGIAWYEIEN